MKTKTKQIGQTEQSRMEQKEFIKKSIQELKERAEGPQGIKAIIVYVRGTENSLMAVNGTGLNLMVGILDIIEHLSEKSAIVKSFIRMALES